MSNIELDEYKKMLNKNHDAVTKIKNQIDTLINCKSSLVIESERLFNKIHSLESLEREKHKDE